jgi:hypothetical protein
MKPLATIKLGKGFAEQNPLTRDWLVYPNGNRFEAPYIAVTKASAKEILRQSQESIKKES